MKPATMNGTSKIKASPTTAMYPRSAYAAMHAHTNSGGVAYAETLTIADLIAPMLVFVHQPLPAVGAELRDELKALLKVCEVCIVVLKLLNSKTDTAIRAHRAVNRIRVVDGPQSSEIRYLARLAFLMRRNSPASRAVSGTALAVLAHSSTTFAPQCGQYS